MNIHKQLSLLVCLCSVGIGQAVPQQIDRAEARRLALKQNKNIGIAHSKSEQASLTQQAVKTNFLPKLSLQAMAYYTTSERKTQLALGSVDMSVLYDQSRLSKLTQSNPQLAQTLQPLLSLLPQSLTFPELPIQTSLNNSYYAALNIDQPIYMGGKITAANRMANIAKDLASTNIRKVEQEVIYSVDEAYLLLLQAQQLRQTAEAYTQAIAEVYRVANNAVSAGMRTKSDLLKVRVEQSKAELQLAKAEQGIGLARMNLNQIVGLPLTEATEVVPEIEGAYTEYELEGQALDLSTRPEYILLNKQAQLKAEQIRLVRSEFLPQLGLRASYSYLRGLRVNDNLLFNNHGPSVMLQLSVPLYRWGEGRHKVKAAQAEAETARLEMEELSQKMLLEQTQARHKYKELRLEVSMYHRIVEESREHLRTERERYKQGLSTTANLLEAETIMSKAESDYIQAQCRLRLQQSALARAYGRLMP